MDAAVEVPRTLDQALDPAWLSRALAPVTNGAEVMAVETVEVLRTFATKVRFKVAFDGAANGAESFCLKGALDIGPQDAGGGPTTMLEADFYRKLADQVPVRVPDCVATVIDRDIKFGVVIMRDVIAQGGRFGSALDAFTPDQAAESLGQLALLHTGAPLLAESPWIGRRVMSLANATYMTPTLLQELLDGPRGEGFDARTRDATLLIASLKALAAEDETTPDMLVHGDSHAGNIFRTADGPGLIDWQLLQRAGWSLDVAYHINAVLPAEVAEANERALLSEYLERARGLGVAVPDDEAAWLEYRKAAVYGYYLWAITRRVDPAITVTFVQRLGAAVRRHDSFRLLGI